MNWVEQNRPWLESARRHWAPRSVEPLRLRAWLSAPVSWDGYDPLTLEGALQYTVVGAETGLAPDDVFAECPRETSLADTDIQVPIADTRMLGCWVPIAMASVAWFSSDAAATVRWRRRRIRDEHIALDKFTTSTATLKSSNLPAAAVTALWVDWYVRGDAARLRELLPLTTHLSAHRSGGMGTIHGWEVSRAPDWWLTGPGGRLMRTVPAVACVKGHTCETRQSTLRAPYWHKRSLTLCHVPMQELGEALS